MCDTCNSKEHTPKERLQQASNHPPCPRMSTQNRMTHPATLTVSLNPASLMRMVLINIILN